MADDGDGSASTGGRGDERGRLSAMGSNGMVIRGDFPIFLDSPRGDCPPVFRVEWSTAFLTLEEGLDLYDNCVTRKAGESTGNMCASSFPPDAALISSIKAW